MFQEIYNISHNIQENSFILKDWVGQDKYESTFLGGWNLCSSFTFCSPKKK